MNPFAWFASFGPTAAEIRAEVWKLGVRHHGHPLEGARQELARHGLEPSKAALLRACVRDLHKTEGRQNRPPLAGEEAESHGH